MTDADAKREEREREREREKLSLQKNFWSSWLRERIKESESDNHFEFG